MAKKQAAFDDKIMDDLEKETADGIAKKKKEIDDAAANKKALKQTKSQKDERKMKMRVFASKANKKK